MKLNIFENKGDLAISEQISLEAFERKCPHLGMREDPATILGYPDPINYCFRHKKSVPVSMKTQSILCLTNQYGGCAILQAEKPEAVEGAQAKERVWVKRARPAAVVIPLILLLIAALVWWPTPGTSIDENSGQAAPLQKTTGSETTAPAVESQINEQPLVEQQGKDADEVTADEATVESMEPALYQTDSLSPAADISTDRSAGGFRVHRYD